MFILQNQPACLVGYNEEPEVSITLGLDLEYEDGQWYVTNLEKIPISRMTTRVRENLDSLIVHCYDGRGVTYNAIFDETGHINYLLDIQNIPMPRISNSSNARAYRDGSKIIVINKRTIFGGYEESPVEKITFLGELKNQTLTIDENMSPKVRKKLRELGRNEMPEFTGVIYSGVEDEAGHIIKLTDVKIVRYEEMLKEMNG